MVSQKIAYIDEFGAFGFKFENPGCSTHFILTAIIVDPSDVETVKNGVVEIRKKYFQSAPEIKSKYVGRDYKRRLKVLAEMRKLPFKIFALVYDKRKIFKSSGLRYKKSFYKFINRLAYHELSVCFPKIEIVADETGYNDFMKSFAKYMREQITPTSLFNDDFTFNYKNSQRDDIIQVADFISGTLAYIFDQHKKQDNKPWVDYRTYLANKILRIKQLPNTYDHFDPEEEFAAKEYTERDKLIARIAYRAAADFVAAHRDSKDENVVQQLIVLEYLLARFMNHQEAGYIKTHELISQLESMGYERTSVYVFRTKIIAKLRDNEVILASSKNGYKIPARESEVEDFINHGKSIILPMLSRLQKCNEKIRMSTNAQVDFFEKAKYMEIASLLNPHVHNQNVPIES